MDIIDPSRVAALRAHLVTLLAGLTLSGLLAWQRDAPPATAVRVLPAPSPAPVATATFPSWQVHVTGAVARAGLVRLPPGARVAEAVAAVGGFSAEADGEAINLAAPVADGQQLHVPAHGEPTRPSDVPSSPAVGALAPAMPDMGTSGGSVIAPGLGVPPTVAGGPLIDINTAGAPELESLPGVGPALAARILAQRQAKGPFRSVRDLLEVSGVGEKTLARFADLVVVR